MDLHAILGEGVNHSASDIHLKFGVPPILRVNGHLLPIEGYPALDREHMAALTGELLTEYHREKLSKQLQVDLGYGHPEYGRFRVNVFYQRGELQAALRLIPPRVRHIRELNLPPIIERIAQERRGLVLVTGTTGSGKSTTLAAMIDYVNATFPKHIITIEDPLEFVHERKRCLINQREVGAHTSSFAAALRGALREDPDILLVGELRDLETTSLAITAAETGHLVFGTLHTNSAPKTIDRLVDIFPADRQAQIRTMLSESLEGVVAQTLIPTADGKGRVAATRSWSACPRSGT